MNTYLLQTTFGQMLVVLVVTFLLASCSKDQVISIQPLGGLRLELADHPTKAQLPDAFDAHVEIFIKEDSHFGKRVKTKLQLNIVSEIMLQDQFLYYLKKSILKSMPNKKAATRKFV